MINLHFDGEGVDLVGEFDLESVASDGDVRRTDGLQFGKVFLEEKTYIVSVVILT